MWIMVAKLLLLAFMAHLCDFNVAALKCYSCTLAVPEDGSKVDMSCVNDPDNAPGKHIITCPARMTYCTIVRNDYKDTGEVSSIERNCAETPVILNDDIEGPDMIYHYRSCTTDLCNKGTGQENPNNGDEGDTEGGFVVPGLGKSSNNTASKIVCLISLSSALLLSHFHSVKRLI